MILSAQSLFSDDQDLSQTAGNYASTNVIDLGATGTPVEGAAALVRDIGKGTPIPLLMQVTETFTSGGAATLVVALQVDDNDSFSSATTVWTSETLALATLAAGYELPIDYVPQGVNERYVRLYYTIGTATTTAGTVTAGFAAGRQQPW